MSKSHDDEVYEKGVKDGQKGDFLEDGIMGSGAGDMIPGGGKDWETYKKGYSHGAEHRYDKDGNRYHSYDGSGSNDKSSSDNSSSDSLCFITNACTKAMNLPDDCYELQTLRAFRDKVLAKSELGKMIVERYYNIAPSIVKAIECDTNAGKIWSRVYEEIRLIVQKIQEKEYTDAIKDYAQMTQRLYAQVM
jgi:hypothetical protein